MCRVFAGGVVAMHLCFINLVGVLVPSKCGRMWPTGVSSWNISLQMCGQAIHSCCCADTSSAEVLPSCYLRCCTCASNYRYKRHLPKSGVTGAMVWAGSAAVMAVGFYFVIEGRKQRACVESFASSLHIYLPPSSPHGLSPFRSCVIKTCVA